MTSDIQINEWALKVEIQNAEAMIDGFRKDNKHYYITIFCAPGNAVSMRNKFEKNPKILTPIRGETKKEHPLSGIGEGLNANDYDLPAKYIAVLYRIFHIENNIKIWEELCNNGIYDIWKPEAPFNNLNGKKDPKILLLRIFEIDSAKTIELGGSYDVVKNYKESVKVVRPIIPYNKYEHDRNNYKYNGNLYFEDIIKKVTDAVKPFLKGVKEYPHNYLNSNISQPSVSKEEFENAIDKLNEKDVKSNDAEIKALRRTEQGYLRSQLFEGKEEFECGICRNRYPVLFLVAAHIKKRSECTLEEQNDKSIVMPMCKFGCDELYENGYISVKEGKVMQIKEEPITPSAQRYINEIERTRCVYWNENTSEYFNWHYNRHFARES